MRDLQYLQGVKDCEKLLQEGWDLVSLERYIDQESSIGGYKWNNWSKGFSDAIGYFGGVKRV